MSGFVKRAITAQFSLLSGNFKGQTGNTVSVTGLRAHATISKTGGQGMSTAEIHIFGMRMDLMNQLSTLGKYPNQERGNKITIKAGDAVSGMPVVFYGDISQAWIDFAAAPEIGFVVLAFTGMVDAMRPLPPTSFNGTVDAATVLSGLAQQMGYTFENNGVSVILSHPYWPGTGRQQAYACAKAANINIMIDDEKLAIWPKGGSRGGAIPLISPTSGLVGYPAYTEQGINITSLYNPAIISGGRIKVQSSIPQACGIWPVFSLVHDLESETPDGQWFSHASCQNFGSVAHG